MKKPLAKKVLSAHKDYVTGLRLHNLQFAVESITTKKDAVYLLELVSLIASLKGDKRGRLKSLMSQIKVALNRF